MFKQIHEADASIQIAKSDTKEGMTATFIQVALAEKPKMMLPVLF